MPRYTYMYQRMSDMDTLNFQFYRTLPNDSIFLLEILAKYRLLCLEYKTKKSFVYNTFDDSEQRCVLTSVLYHEHAVFMSCIIF